MNIDEFMSRLGFQESTGDSSAVNPDTGASGTYQILPENWAGWAVAAGLPADAPQTAENQYRVAHHEIEKLYGEFGNWEDVAAAWYSGQPRDPKTIDLPQGGGKYPTIRQYISQLVGTGGSDMDWRSAPITQGFGPTDEPLDGPYGGYAHFNKGLDFGVPAGTAIDSPISGTVVSAGDSGDGWGVSVKIRDADGFTHNFGHLSSASVAVGQKVTAGTVVGKSGDTGKSTGPHLSYDVWDGSGKFVDPTKWVGGTSMPPNNGRAITSNSVSFTGDQGAAGGTADVGSQADQADAIVRHVLSMEPTTAQYPDPEDFAIAHEAWAEELSGVADTASKLRDLSGGVVKMPDGSFVPWGTLPADQQAAIQQANDQIFKQLQQKYGLDQFQAETDRTQADFQNQMARVGASTNIDDTNLQKSSQDIDRFLSGLSESRNRADLISSTQLKAAPYTTANGKTSFTGADLGGAVSGLAAFLGLDPGQALLNYPGTVNVDPQSLLTQFDTQFGVTGEIPKSAQLITTPDMIPAAPNLPSYPSNTLTPIAPRPAPSSSILDTITPSGASVGAAPASAGINNPASKFTAPWEPPSAATSDSILDLLNPASRYGKNPTGGGSSGVAPITRSPAGNLLPAIWALPGVAHGASILDLIDPTARYPK